jgi:hypothetical protein
MEDESKLLSIDGATTDVAVLVVLRIGNARHNKMDGCSIEIALAGWAMIQVTPPLEADHRTPIRS